MESLTKSADGLLFSGSHVLSTEREDYFASRDSGLFDVKANADSEGESRTV